MGLPAFVQTSETIDVICTVDSAVDDDSMTEDEVVGYLREPDISKLKLKDGEDPVVFTIRAMGALDLGATLAVERSSASPAADYHKKTDVIRSCLKGAKGLKRGKKGGGVEDVEFKTEIDVTGQYHREIAHREIMECISPGAVEELYIMINSISTVSDDQKKS